MGGESSSQKRARQLAEQQAAEDRRRMIQLQEQAAQPTPGQERFERQASEWDTWLQNKDYSHAPGILGMNLWMPSQIQKQTEKMRDLEGVGAAGLGGDKSIALQFARERNANEAAQNAGAAYEDAVGRQDAYFKGADPGWAGMQIGQMQGLLGNATNSYQFQAGMHNQMLGRQRSFWDYIAPMIGGGISAAGSLFGGSNRGG